MVSDQQNLLNLGSAANLAKINLNLDLITPSEWSDDDMVNYLAQLSALILANPNAFTADTLATANYVAGQNLNSLITDPSGEMPLLKYELENNAMAAGSDLAKLGQGTLHLIGSIGGTAANLGSAAEGASAAADWIIPIAAVAIVYLLIREPERGVKVAGDAAGSATRAARNFLPW